MKKIMYPLMSVFFALSFFFSSSQAYQMTAGESAAFTKLLSIVSETIETDRESVQSFFEKLSAISHHAEDERISAIIDGLVINIAGLLGSQTDLELQSVDVSCKGKCLRVYVCAVGEHNEESAGLDDIQLKTILNNAINTQRLSLDSFLGRCGSISYDLAKEFSVTENNSYSFSSYVDSTHKVLETNESNNGFSGIIVLNPESKREYNVAVR